MTNTPTLIGLALTPRIMAPMEEQNSADVSVEAGMAGDARGGKSRRQISILFEQDWLDAVAETGEPMHWMERRANMFVTGMRSPQKLGGTFTIGDLTLEVIDETEPCEVMEGKRAGLMEALSPDWRGGVCCKVISAGHVKIGDHVNYNE